MSPKLMKVYHKQTFFVSPIYHTYDLLKEGSSSTVSNQHFVSAGILWSVVIYFFYALSKFVFGSHKISTIITLNQFYISSPSNLNARMNKSVSKVFIISIWIARLAKQVKSAKCTILLQSCSSLIDFKQTEYVHTTVSEWWFFLCSIWW